MKLKHSRLSFAISAILVILLAAGAMATTVTYTTTTPVPLTKTDWAAQLLFPQFNVAGSVLTQVDIEISADLQTVISITNYGGSASTGRAWTHVLVAPSDPLFNFACDMNSPILYYTLAPNQSVTSGTLATTGSGSGSYTDAAMLSRFIGTGSAAIDLGTFTETAVFNNGGNTAASQVTNAGATGKVTYHYEPIPEPSSIVGLLSGIVGIGGMFLRRRSA